MEQKTVWAVVYNLDEWNGAEVVLFTSKPLAMIYAEQTAVESGMQGCNEHISTLWESGNGDYIMVAEKEVHND